MESNLKRFKTLNSFKKEEPEISTRVFKLATRVSLGFLDENNRQIPKWPKAIVWFCNMIQPEHDGSRYGCDPLQVEHALLEYCRKPLYVAGCKDPWGLMTHVANHNNTRIKIDEVRWEEYKRQDRIDAKDTLSKLGSLIPEGLRK